MRTGWKIRLQPKTIILSKKKIKTQESTLVDRRVVEGFLSVNNTAFQRAFKDCQEMRV